MKFDFTLLIVSPSLNLIGNFVAQCWILTETQLRILFHNLCWHEHHSLHIHSTNDSSHRVWNYIFSNYYWFQQLIPRLVRVDCRKNYYATDTAARGNFQWMSIWWRRKKKQAPAATEIRCGDHFQVALLFLVMQSCYQNTIMSALKMLVKNVRNDLWQQVPFRMVVFEVNPFVWLYLGFRWMASMR